MDLSLDNYYLHVGFNSMGGALSSIKDKDGTEVSLAGRRALLERAGAGAFPNLRKLKG